MGRAANQTQLDKVIEEAARILTNGGLVAFPTETVYGLGANARNKDAAKKIYEAKGRPSDNPLILHICSYDMLDEVADEIPPAAKALADRFWPGPLTLIMNKSDRVPLEVTGGLSTVGVRFPGHKIALELIRRSKVPVAAPSANVSGRPSPTRASHVEYDLSGKIDMIIDGGSCGIGIESTIVDTTGGSPVVLRPGSITEKEIAETAGCLLGGQNPDAAPKAPGTMYKHYSPEAKITIVKGGGTQTAGKINSLIAEAEKQGKKAGVLVTEEYRALYNKGTVITLGSMSDLSRTAAHLYKALRELDFNGLDIVYCTAFPEDGLGVAIMNRLIRAAENRIIDLRGEK